MLRVSIVIPSYDSAATIETCLASLVPQCDASTEILVVDSGTDDAAERIAKRFPGVGVIRSAERLYPGAARNLGVRRARGDLIGFVDADCIAAPDWVARVRDAHAGVRSAVGGVIANEAPRRYLDWAAYFCSFHHWMPGTPAGTVRDIPTCCLSFRRDVLDRHGPFLEADFSSDTEFNWRVTAAGTPLYLDPAIRVAHRHHPTWRSFARRQWSRGYAFARMRVQAESFSAIRRGVYALGVAAVPLLRTTQLMRRVFAYATPPDYRRAFAASAPLVLLGFTLWALGEAAGYVWGGVGSRRRSSVGRELELGREFPSEQAMQHPREHPAQPEIHAVQKRKRDG